MKKLTTTILISILIIYAITLTAYSLGFKDVTNDKWYWDAVNYVSEEGIMTGSNGYFYPNKPVTRAELAQVTMEIMQSQDNDIKDEISNILSKVESVVLISTADGTYGSGIAISKNLILTANHVVKNSTDKTCKVAIGERYSEYIGQIIKQDVSLDLAIIKVDKELKPITIADSDIGILDEIYIIGHPLSLRNSFSYGTVGNVGVYINGKARKKQLNVNVNSGNSGGCVLNSNGELVGIVISKLSPELGEGLAFSSALENITEFIKDVD